MRDALLLVALICGEVAALMIAFSWLAFPSVVDLVKEAHLYPLWMLGSVIGGLVAPVLAGHWLIERYGD